jgi:hypothetical protein
MVTAAPIAVSAAAQKAGASLLGIVVLVVIAAWVLLLAVLVIYAAVVFTRRGQVQRQRQALPRAPARPRSGRSPAGVTALRDADPAFDEQLLLDAAQTATFLVFAAMTTGDVAPIGRLVTSSFWQAPFGRITQLAARDRRRETARAATDPAGSGHRSRSRWNIPVDYHPSVPELIAVSLGREQRVRVRVSFDQLAAIVRPGAQDFAAGAAAVNIGSALASAGRAVASRAVASAQASSAQPSSVAWVASGGHYDLTFSRPSGGTTDPAAALADRTCVTCGATYQSELAIACQHCQAPRLLPWGDWRLADAQPVQ